MTHVGVGSDYRGQPADQIMASVVRMRVDADAKMDAPATQPPRAESSVQHRCGKDDAHEHGDDWAIHGDCHHR